ncbi:hypothetical protein KJ359_007016 [Pestalotiopsis sp. 9143b]|nr:hypothetical protein KJ359_007016 [Pestalotiopsis sp. 9143b]
MVATSQSGTVDLQAGDSGHNTSQNGPTRPGGYVDFMNNEDETRAWIQNSIAMFTDPAKKLTTAYYQEPPKKMYYAGCSTGGAQGFALAQYHPEIFDGIFAGSPGNWYSHLILSFLWNGMNSNNTGSFMDQQALDFIKNAVLAECDAMDGVTDGLIENPENCDFDISSLQCSGDQQPVTDNTTVCLTSAQIENAKLFYAGPTNNDTGASIYPGFALGSEAEWTPQESSLWIEYGIPILQNLVFKNLSYDYTQFNWGSDVDLVDRAASPLIDEISANLTGFQQRGGKLIVTQGWADPYNAPTWPIEHRGQMQDIFGDELDDFFGLFMVPGGGHCSGAESYPQMPGTWHALEALVSWVEQDSFPEAILASDSADGSNSTRKLCPYPQNAVYIGGGGGNWESYTCQ